MDEDLLNLTTCALLATVKKLHGLNSLSKQLIYGMIIYCERIISMSRAVFYMILSGRLRVFYTKLARLKPSPSPLAQRRFLIPLTVFFAVTMGCSASDLVQRQRVTPTPTPAVTLVPTFTATPIPVQTLLIITPPAQGKPGVIIIPPGMDPNSVIPIAPTATATPIPSETLQPLATAMPSATASPTALQASSPLIIATGTPSEQAVLMPTVTPTTIATSTPIPQPTDTPTTLPTPFVSVDSGLVALRTGPGWNTR